MHCSAKLDIVDLNSEVFVEEINFSLIGDLVIAAPRRG